MSQFVTNLEEVFRAFGVVTTRRMFGGHGVFHEGSMIALVADDVLYRKVDDASVGAFTERGSTPFEHDKGGTTMKMSYYSAPEDMFDDPEVARSWAALAYEAALRAKASRPRRAPAKMR